MVSPLSHNPIGIANLPHQQSVVLNYNVSLAAATWKLHTLRRCSAPACPFAFGKLMTPPFFPFVPNSDRISTGDRIPDYGGPDGHRRGRSVGKPCRCRDRAANQVADGESGGDR